jgi:hypothetical protein
MGWLLLGTYAGLVVGFVLGCWWHSLFPAWRPFPASRRRTLRRRVERYARLTAGESRLPLDKIALASPKRASASKGGYAR